MLVSFVVISINLYFSTDYILNALGTSWYVWLLLIVPTIIYMAFVLYLVVDCLQAIGLVSKDFYYVNFIWVIKFTRHHIAEDLLAHTIRLRSDSPCLLDRVQ